MYKIFADDTLIYDSTTEDYKIGKGSISLETNKSGSFSFSIYPDHFYYDNFVRLKTVITVYKSDKIVFRGRILNDVTDHWNNKSITCEGELGFLQDSIIRPFIYNSTPKDLFKKFIEEHNSQVDNFKKFKIGTVTVVDPNNYIARSNSEYESALSNLNSRLIEDSLGGYFYITHGDNGTDPIPTINYLADFTKVSTQKIEFGSNLKKYTKTVKANDIATAIIPLGHEVDDGDDNTENKKLTITSVNDGKDYVYSEEGVALYGWIFKTVSFDDVTDARNLKSKAEAYLNEIVKQNITIELNAIDLHLLDRSIESFNIGDYIQVISVPHNINTTLLCNKQTIDILNPNNDSVTLGRTYSVFTESNGKLQNNIKQLDGVYITKSDANTKISISENKMFEVMNASYATKDELNNVSAEVEFAIKTNESGELVSAIKIKSDLLTIDTDYFKLSSKGEVTATKGTLGGWIIDNDYIRSSEGIYGTYKFMKTTTGTDLIYETYTGYMFYYMHRSGFSFRICNQNDWFSTVLYADSIARLSALELPSNSSGNDHTQT